MTEEINAGMEPERPKGTINPVLGIVIFVIVIALATGIIWYWYNKTAPAETNGYLNLSQISKSPSPSLTPTPSASTSSSPSASPTSTVCTKDRAVSVVRNLSDVKDYLQRVPDGMVEYDHEDQEIKAWVVHVYEIVRDHTATFNWYNVDKTTCQATAIFP